MEKKTTKIQTKEGMPYEQRRSRFQIETGGVGIAF